MKLAILIGIAIASQTIFAESDPYELLALRAKRDLEYAKIDTVYLQELKKLKTQFTKAGDLKNALLIEEAIQSVYGKGEEKRQEFVLDGEWSYYINGKKKAERRFENGKMVDEIGDVHNIELKGERLTIRWEKKEGHNNNGWEKLTLNPATPNVFKGVNPKGTEVEYRRK